MAFAAEQRLLDASDCSGRQFPKNTQQSGREKYVSELDILQNYFPDIKYLPTTINSPLRQDIHPSFSIFKSEDKVLYKDFSTGESGDIYTLLEKIWGCSFIEVIDRLYKELNVEKYTVNPTNFNTTTTPAQPKDPFATADTDGLPF